VVANPSQTAGTDLLFNILGAKIYPERRTNSAFCAALQRQWERTRLTTGFPPPSDRALGWICANANQLKQENSGSVRGSFNF